MAFNNMWAFIVEDDAHSLIAISSILRELGITYKRNTTGAGVVQQLLSMQPCPDFILLDLSLPLADPFELTDSIRSDPALCDIPIICLGEIVLGEIVLDEIGTNHTIERAQKCGCTSYLAKPLPRRQFADLLRRILDGEQLWALAV
jgi:CheY-like chemotaxis protein